MHGVHALRFCQQRGLATEGLHLTRDTTREQEGKRVTLVRIAVQLPAGFPEKYRVAIERAIDHRAVKKHIVEPPRFEFSLSDASREPAALSGAFPRRDHH